MCYFVGTTVGDLENLIICKSTRIDRPYPKCVINPQNERKASDDVSHSERTVIDTMIVSQVRHFFNSAISKCHYAIGCKSSLDLPCPCIGYCSEIRTVRVKLSWKELILLTVCDMSSQVVELTVLSHLSGISESLETILLSSSNISTPNQTLIARFGSCASISLILVKHSFTLKGLGNTSSAPACLTVSICSCLAFAVIAIILN